VDLRCKCLPITFDDLHLGVEVSPPDFNVLMIDLIHNALLGFEGRMMDFPFPALATGWILLNRVLVVLSQDMNSCQLGCGLLKSNSA
jgi:hypothetical protein